MRIKIAMLFLLASIGLNTFAYNKIKINILENKSGLPLVGATMMYSDNKNMENPKYAVADKKGRISFTAQHKEVYYNVSMVGFNPVSGKIGNREKVLTLKMEENVVDLSGVVVNGTTTPRLIKLSPITTQVLNAREMVEAGYENLQKALEQETPGLSIQKVAFGNEINMQGLDARHVLFLMDGERLTGDMAGNLDYERFNLHAIDHIEIIKGGSSALYGSRATGAVINLITKKTTKPLNINAGVRYGQMNETNYKHPSKKDFLYMYEKNVDKPNLQGWVSAGFNAGKFTSQTDIWYSESDAYYLHSQERFKKTYKKSTNTFLKNDTSIISDLKPSSLGISGTEHISASQKIYFHPWKDLEIQAYGTYFFMNTYDLIQDLVFTQAEDLTGGAKITWNLKNWVSVKANFHADYYDRYKRHERRDERRKVYKSRIFYPKIKITSKYFKNHNLTFGTEYFTDELTSDRFVNRKMTSRALKETECFLQDEWTISPKWMTSAGIRSDFSKQFGLKWMPKIAIKFSPDENWSFRTSYSLGYRSPTIKELFFNWDHLGMFMIRGNEYLKPEENNYISFGTEYSNDRFFINATVYDNYYKDKIEGVWKIYDMEYNFVYTNLDHQNLFGGEIISRYNILDNVTLNASYSYVNVEKTRKYQFNTTSPHTAVGGIKYKYRRKNYYMNAGISASFTGRKKFDVQDRLMIDGLSHEAFFRCNLPGYTLCNITISQTFCEKVRLVIGVDNIFNYKPEITGAGLTAFNVPATAGTRAHIQLELKADKLINMIKKKK